MIYKNLDWLFKIKDSNQSSIYPNYIVGNLVGNYRSNSALAWCYGDLGITLSLFSLANIFNDVDICNEAVETIKHSLTRINEVKNTKVHSICHGTSGVAFILKQLENNYGIDTKCQALIALNETLDKAYSCNSPFPYQNIIIINNEYVHQDNTSFLEGLSGIGLVLLNFVSDVKPNWRKCLLI